MEIEAELTLRKENMAYVAELRARHGEESPPVGSYFVVIDAQELADLESEPERYGQALSEALFQENGLVWALGQTYGVARGSNASLRLRLLIDRSAAELDALQWELMRIPGSNDCLSTCEDILFSRYMPSRRKAPPLRDLENLSALGAVASPEDIEKAFHHTELWEVFNKDALLSAIGEHLDSIPLDYIPEEDEFCTLDLLARGAVGHDLVVLSAHCEATPEGPVLLLENAEGKTRAVAADKVGARMQKLRALPRLLVLLGDNTAQAVPALMGELGVPAVIGIYGNLDAELADPFIRALCGALREDSAVDRAAAAARRVIGEQCEEWVPALFMNAPGVALYRGAGEREPEGDKTTAGEKSPRGKLPPSPPEPLRIKIYKILDSPAFQIEDVEKLCFLLEVDWEALRGETRSIKVISLIRHFEGLNRLEDLAAEIRRARPELKL